MGLLKKILVTLGFILLINNGTHCQSNDKFTYFPMNDGNKWYFSWFRSVDNSIRTIIEAKKDTLLSDGKVYKQFDRIEKTDSGWVKTSGAFFLRLENNIIYNYKTGIMLNYLWDDSTRTDVYNLIRIRRDDIFNQKRLTYYCFIYYPYQYSSYTDSIGFNALDALEWRDWTQESRYLVGCEIDGKVYGKVITGVEKNNNNELFTDYKLYQNYPNPFNPSTTIEFQLQKKSYVELKVMNVLGETVATLISEARNAGIHKVNFDASNLSSGIYFYVLYAGKFNSIKKMVYIK